MGLTQHLGRLLRVAADNHHLLHTADLRADGLTSQQISSLVRAGVLERITRGLYRPPGTRSLVQDIAAAVSRHADGAGSHTSALFVHDIDAPQRGRPHVTLPPGSTGRTSLGQLHRSPLDPIDVTRRRRIPVTTVARAVVDSAEVLSVPELASVLDVVMTAQKATIGQILEVAHRLESAPGRVGSGRLRAALGPWTEPIRPDSPAEAAAIRRITDAGLPVPETQWRITDVDGEFVARVDLAWPDAMVLREYDSPGFHGPSRTEADEIRRARLEALGWATGSVQRQHLRPGITSWLEKLAADLGAAGLDRR